MINVMTLSNEIIDIIFIITQSKLDNSVIDKIKVLQFCVALLFTLGCDH